LAEARVSPFVATTAGPRSSRGDAATMVALC
jgi:hypothetical protein